MISQIFSCWLFRLVNITPDNWRPLAREARCCVLLNFNNVCLLLMLFIVLQFIHCSNIHAVYYQAYTESSRHCGVTAEHSRENYTVVQNSWTTPHFFILCFQAAKVCCNFFKLCKSLVSFQKVLQSFF